MSLLNIFQKNSQQAQRNQTKTKEDEKGEATLVEKKYSTLKSKEAGAVLSNEKNEVKARKDNKDDTKEAYKVLIKPLVTEKATELSAVNKYCFEVAKNANKITIKKAIKSLYGVSPLSVNVIIVRGKAIRSGRITGKKKSWKKAIVALKPGEKIQIYEGI